MLNQQPPEGRTQRDDGALDVIDIWDTIQGEGPFVGSPAVFVRLAGCQLQCPSCDTQYTEGRHLMPVVDIVSAVDALRPGGLVVVTGGEPFRQDLAQLVQGLSKSGHGVQIETNGGIYREGFPFGLATIVCSPKGTVRKELRPHIAAWKYVVTEGRVDWSDGLPTSALGMPTRPARPEPGVPVYVQPCDEQDEAKNRRNLEVALESCRRFGYRLCLQIHKIAGLA